MNVSKDFEELFAFFNARNVKVLIVGGYAVAFHAKPRFTKDIDLWVEPTPENAERLLAALSDFGFGSLPLTIDDFTQPVFYLGKSDLMRNKELVARPQDQADLEWLRSSSPPEQQEASRRRR